MTTEQLHYINSASRGINTIESLLADPAHLKIVKSAGRSGIYYLSDDYYLINKNVSDTISLILENAQQAITCILGQELIKLKRELYEMEIQNLDISGNERD